MFAGSAIHGYSFFDFRTDRIEKYIQYSFCVWSTTFNNGTLLSTSADNLLEYNFLND